MLLSSVTSSRFGTQGDTVNCVTATVTITITNDVEPPVAEPDTTNTVPGGTVTISILNNDTDDVGLDPTSVMLIDPLTGLPVTTLTIPGEGTYVVNSDGTVTFTAAPGFSGTSTVTYEVSDAAGNTASSTISIFVPGRPTAIPTLSEWALLLMMLLMVGVAARQLRFQRR